MYFIIIVEFSEVSEKVVNNIFNSVFYGSVKKVYYC